MNDVAQLLRSKLGSAANKVPIRVMPDFVFRFLSLFDYGFGRLRQGLEEKIGIHRKKQDDCLDGVQDHQQKL